MKKLKTLLNIIIIILGIFFAYQVFSYIQSQKKEKESIQVYKEIKTSSETKYKETGQKDYQSLVDFENLRKINPEIFAWIKSDECRIDYPLLVTADNEKYLHTLANGEKNLMGAVFMDYRNESLDDDFILIYAHTTNNGTMFGSLNEFKKDPEKTGFTFYTEKNEIRTRAIAAAIISGDTEIDPRVYKDYKEREKFYNFVEKNAVYKTDYKLKQNDKIINLITCTYEKQNSRLIVVTVVE